MKAFANITLGQVSKALTEIAQMPNAVCADFYPEHINWQAVAEYIFEVWGNEYDNDDIDLVHNNLWFNGETDWIYILEVQEDKYGDEQLVIETIYA